jgi:hypothetical protein
MKILKISQFNYDKELIVIKVEGYPHAEPVFPNGLSDEEIQKRLEAWKINQDAVDDENKRAIQSA